MLGRLDRKPKVSERLLLFQITPTTHLADEEEEEVKQGKRNKNKAKQEYSISR